MKKPELYHKTVDILVQAYFNDTLMHNTCYACAVGNIIAANLGVKVLIKNSWNGMGLWSGEKELLWSKVIQLGNVINRKDKKAIEQIEVSGYSVSEMARIEKAFESAPGNHRDDFDDEWMFNGLMAVIEVLDQIHENTDTEVTKVTKQKFVRA